MGKTAVAFFADEARIKRYEAAVSCVVEEDILRRLWGKWMLNVGVNQVVMVSEGNYGTI